MNKENLSNQYTMDKIYNKKTKRYNTIKTALKNDILNKPDDFEIPNNRVFVKKDKGYGLELLSKASKYVKKSEDILAVNKNVIFNPKTGKLLKKTKQNIKKVKENVEQILKQKRINEVLNEVVEDKIYGFTNTKFFVNTQNLRELYENIKVRINQKGQFGNVILYFRNLETGEIRQQGITIQSNYLDTFTEFKDRVENIMAGNVVGSDMVDENEWELVLNVYNIVFTTIAVGGSSKKLLFECVGCDSEEKKCYYNVLCHLFPERTEEQDKDFKHYRNRELKELMETIKNNGKEIYWVSNTFLLKKNPVEIFKNRPIEKINYIFGKKEFMFKLVKLEQDDINHPHINFGDECLIYDADEKHIDYTKNFKFCDNVYMSMDCRIFKKINDEFVFITNSNKINKTNDAYKGQRMYIFYDFETIIDWNEKGCFKEYSVSWFCCNDNVLKTLEEFDEDNNKKKLNNLIEGKVYNEVGYDCCVKFIDWVLQKQVEYENVNFDFVSYNGSNFDNIIMLRNLLNYTKRELTIDNIFYNGNQLLDFRINGKHNFFDLNKHLVGSLNNNCKSFKVNIVSKTSFNHHTAQMKHDEGTLIDFMTGNEELINYNNMDVLSLAVIMRRYMNALESSKYTEEYGKNISGHKTIGGVIWNVATNYWKGLRLRHDITEEKEIYEKQYSKTGKELKKQKKTIIKEKKVVKKPITFPKMDFKTYKDMLKFKCAGRVEMFNGVQEINEEVMSLDICSMYPYVMCILDEAYYPYGDIVETDIFNEDLIGFYYCDIDQSILKEKNLPNIYPKKVFNYKKNGEENGLLENDWGTEEILEDYLISSVMIKQLKKWGCNVKIKKGFYFSNKVKGCELFKFILDFMKMKNEQDTYKKDKPELYNSALRETLKLIMNSLSGKVIEGLHTEKTESVDNYKFEALLENEKVESINCINIIGNKVFTTYKVKEETMISKQRPVYLGCLIYDYSKCYIYNYGYSVIGKDRLLYTDTDALKFRRSEFNRDDVKEFYNKVFVPHWKEVEKVDNRYNNFIVYNTNDKVFGSFEDEMQGLGINYFSCFQKKSWVAMNTNKYNECIKDNNYDDLNKYFKMSFKGVPKTSIILKGDEDFIDVKKNKNGEITAYVINDMKKANDYFNTSTNKIMYNLPFFCDTLHKERKINVLCVNFRRVIKNTNRKVEIKDNEKFNILNNTIQFCPLVKTISI